MRIENVYFEITNLCNLNCITCYNRSGLNQCRQELSFQQITQAIQRLSSEFGCHNFAFAGGEPFLHSEISSLLAYMKEHTEFYFRFVTNGTLHTPSLFALVHEEPERFHIQISLDGSCEEINALTRGKSSFAKTIAFLDELASPSYRPLVKMVISQKNLTDIEPFFHMVIAHGGTPEYAFIHRNGNATDDWESKALSAQQKIHVLKLLDRLNASSAIKAALPYCTSSCPLANGDDAMSVLIKTDGSVQPCQLLYDKAFTLGNILTDSSDTLQQNMQRIRDLAAARMETDFQCQRCLLRSKCGKGCMASAVYLHGDPLSNDGDCLTRKLEIVDFELKRQMQQPAT